MSGRSVAVAKVGDELAHAAQIRRALDCEDDPALLLGMIEGETNLFEAICALYEETAEDEAILAGIGRMVEQMKARMARMEKAIEDRRNIILMAMEKAGVQTIKSPLATLTVKRTPPQIEVADEAEVPAKFWRIPDPKIDKKALNEAVKAGEDVPGVRKTNGGIALQVRGG